MSDPELNIAIAEACGWRFCPVSAIPSNAPDYAERKVGAIMCWARPGADDWQIERLPDYCNDLNAAHAAEAQLSKGQARKYAEELMDAVRAYPIGVVPNWDNDRGSLVVVAHATARQRAEALYRTLNPE